MEGLVIAAIILAVLLIIVAMAVRRVNQYQRLVILRFGKFIGERQPGLRAIIPIVDEPVRVDVREFNLAVPHQSCITRDNAPVAVDFLIYMRVVNAPDSVIQARDYETMAQGIATTTLRAVIGDILLDDVLARREQINQVLRVKLDEVTERWGVKVTGVEIREIIPPRDVQEAMTRQMAAERNRRAVVTEADGTREAAILQAEGAKQAVILRAEGDRQAAILRAEGFALALDKIYAVAKTVDGKTMSLQYLETLKSLGEGPATKFVLPMEFTNLLRPLVDYTESIRGQEQGGR